MRQRARDPESTNQELSRKERVRQLQRETLRGVNLGVELEG